MLMRLRPHIVVATLICGMTGFASASFGADVQMLPPVTFDGSNQTPCSTTTGGLLYWDGTTAIKCIPGSSGDGSGNVSVGGSVQVGSTSAVCTSTVAGAIRFNKNTNVFEGCNGTSWTSLSAQEWANFVTFSTPGVYTWTVPSGVTRIEVEVWGGGGGASGGHGGSGAGGGYALGTYAVTPGTSYAVTVGGGGYAAMYPDSAGPGGSSSFGNLIGAGGGTGGAGGAGPGGNGYGGQLNLSGGWGMDLGGNAEGNTEGGVRGGAAPRGGPGGSVPGSGEVDGGGMDGQQPGGGGGGVAGAAGNGAAGAVLVRY